jgi:hypothetical protein
LAQEVPEISNCCDVGGKECKGRKGLADLDIQEWLELHIGLALRIH